MTESVLFASCRVADLLVGIDLASVQEVAAAAELTPVPLASPLVKGLLNLRGQIVTVVDLRRCLQIPGTSASVDPVHVILRTADGCVSLLVDSVGDMLATDPASVAEPPGALPEELRRLIAGAYQVDGGPLLALDLGRILDLTAARHPSIGA